MKGKQIMIGENLKQKVFYNNLSTYLRLINEFLSKEIKSEKLGKHIKILGGYAFKSSQYQTKGIPIIRISDFQNEKIDLSNAKYYEEKPEYDKYQLFEGDVIIAMTGGTIGKLGIVQKGLGKLYLNQRVGKFKILKPQQFFRRYIYWLARGIQERVKSVGYGEAQPNISGRQIEEMKFPIPDKNIQKLVVGFLEDLQNNKLENKIYFDKETEKEILKLQSFGEELFQVLENSQKDEELLKKLKQSILSEAVQGKLVKQNPKDEPASELLKKIKKEKEKLVRDGKIRKGKELPKIEYDEIPYDLPRGWVWTRLGDVLEFAENFDVQKNLNKKELINYIDIDAIDNNKHQIKEVKLLPVSKLSTRARRVLKKNYIAYSLVRPYLDNIAIIPDNKKNYIGSTGFAVFKPIIVLKRYLFYFLLNPILRNYFMNLLTGFNSPNVGLNNFILTPTSLPPLPEQKRIVEKVDRLMGLCDELEEKIKQNKEYSKKLMGAVLKESFEDGI